MDIKVFEELPVVGILRGITQAHVNPLTSAIMESGLKTIEVTMNTDQAPGLIKEFIKRAEKKFFVGAGTVLSMADLKAALSAGASFIVSPVFVPEVVAYCVKKNIPVFPGALTPQEIFSAWRAGATMVKIFPSGFFGPAYFKDIKGPLHDIKLLACGGVTADNINDYFLNGADAVAFGASVFKKEMLLHNQYQEITAGIRRLIEGRKT